MLKVDSSSEPGRWHRHHPPSNVLIPCVLLQPRQSGSRLGTTEVEHVGDGVNGQVMRYFPTIRCFSFC